MKFLIHYGRPLSNKVCHRIGASTSLGQKRKKKKNKYENKLNVTWVLAKKNKKFYLTLLSFERPSFPQLSYGMQIMIVSSPEPKAHR